MMYDDIIDDDAADIHNWHDNPSVSNKSGTESVEPDFMEPFSVVK